MPGLRENLMERLSREIIIDSEFAALIPPLTDDELKRLEKSIIAEGCRDALVLWGNILIDGHNRYKICMKHNIEFRTIQREFKDRDEVLLWIMQNQLSRRNLSDFQRVELVRKCEDAVKTQAKARQKATQFGGGDKFTTTVEKSRDTLGKIEGCAEEVGQAQGLLRGEVLVCHDTQEGGHEQGGNALKGIETGHLNGREAQDASQVGTQGNEP